jgi:hypothetical protein
VTSDRSSIAVTLVGTYATAASVLSVFELFALESWVGHCRAAERRARETAEATASVDLARIRARSECERALGEYPSWQILATLLALAGLTALGLALWGDVAHWARAYAVLPLLILSLVVFFVTVASTITTRHAVRHAIAQLQEDHPP